METYQLGTYWKHQAEAIPTSKHNTVFAEKKKNIDVNLYTLNPSWLYDRKNSMHKHHENILYLYNFDPLNPTFI